MASDRSLKRKVFDEAALRRAKKALGVAINTR